MRGGCYSCNFLGTTFFGSFVKRIVQKSVAYIEVDKSNNKGSAAIHLFNYDFLVDQASYLCML